MGKISKNGIASGTSGSENISLENTIAPSMNSAIEKIKHDQQQHQDNMAKMLDEAGVEKYSKENLLFVTKDEAGMVIFLEKGNTTAGLAHIINGKHNDNGHLNDFVKKHKISPESLVEHIYKVITEGKLFSYNKEKRGYNRIYLYKSEYYMLSGVGTNGFITTCMPISSKRAFNLKEKYENGKK